MFENGVQKKLWALAQRIARTVETPEHRRNRQKAAEAAAQATAQAAAEAAAEAAASIERSTITARGERESSLHAPTVEDEALLSESGHEEGGGASIPLEAGQELDELAAKCVGALSLMLRSQETADALVGTEHHGLEILLELATVALGK